MSQFWPYASLRVGLVGVWCPALGATGATLIDRSGRNNHGVLTNMAGQNTWPADSGGVALSFDGTNDFVNFGNPAYLAFGSGAFTLSLWVKPTTLPTDGSVLLGKDANPGRQFVLQTNADATAGTAGQLALTIMLSDSSYSGQKTTTNPLTAGTWTHVAAVRSGSSLLIYADGTQLATTAVTGSSAIGAMQSTTTPLYLAARAYAGSEGYYSGLIDDVRIYNRALPVSQVRMLSRRRGIGLQPERSRRFRVYPIATPPNRVYAKSAGIWRPGEVIVNRNDAWARYAAKTIALHAEAEDWAVRVRQNGGTVSSTVLQAVSDFCTAVDASSGLRSKFYRLNLFCGDNLKAALVPLYRGPTALGTTYGMTANDISTTFTIADYWPYAGLRSHFAAGTTKFVNTFLFKQDVGSIFDFHMSARVVGLLNVNSQVGLMNGNTPNSSDRLFFDWNRPSQAWRAFIGYLPSSAGLLDNTVSNADQHHIASRTANNAEVFYSNGTSVATSGLTVNDTGTHGLPFYCATGAGGAFHRMYSIGKGMNATQAAAFSAAVNAFDTAIGRV